MFKIIDTDSSGTITYEKLKDGLKRVESDLVESDIKALMNVVLANFVCFRISIDLSKCIFSYILQNHLAHRLCMIR